MAALGRQSLIQLQRHFPSVRLTGRCYLLRPLLAADVSNAARPEEALGDVECVELTQTTGAAVHSPSSSQRTVPGSLMGNSYYTRRYQHTGPSARARGSGAAPVSPTFVSGDVVLRLHLSAVPPELAHRRIVDVTGVQTSYINSAERSSRALATMDETLRTMHLHDGHEVPAVQRGVVDVVRLQPHCVYAPQSTAGDGGPFDLAHVAAALRPLSNPGVLLAQSRRLSFRSEMDALQTARVMAASVGALGQDASARGRARLLCGVLQPVVREGHLVAVALRVPREVK